MEEISGDLWHYQGRAILALTTNGSLSRDQRAILGRECGGLLLIGDVRNFLTPHYL